MAPKRTLIKGINNERGYVLVGALLILLLLVVIGIAATTSTTLELQIAGNDRIRKETFYQADGGTELAARVTYENALCLNAGGFAAAPVGINGGRKIDQLEVLDLTFAMPTGVAAALPSDAIRDVVFYPRNISDSDSHTNITVGGKIELTPGSDVSEVTGYDSLGQGAAGGGTRALYTMNSQYRGVSESESVVQVGWWLSGYLINSASSYDCNYN